jgi:predicted permease
MTQFLQTLGNWSLVAAAVTTTVLVFYYGIKTSFEQTEVGRQFMLMMLLFASVLDFGALSFLFKLSENGRYITRILIFGGVTFVMLRWVYILYKTQREQRGTKQVSSMKDWKNEGQDDV